MFAFFAIILSVCALVSFVNRKFFGYPFAITLTFTGLCISLLSLILGEVFPGIAASIHTFLNDIDFAHFVTDILLCFLLFAGAFHVHLDDLLSNWKNILSYASIGILIATGLTGGLAWLALHGLGFNVSIYSCLVLGAILSPTDPIAALSILNQSTLPEKQKITIVGESLFNDGFGIVIFLTLLPLALEPDTFTGRKVLILFVKEVLGGVGLGLVLGAAGIRFMKAIDHYQTELLISLALVFGTYSLASTLHFSGPLATVVLGLLLGNQGRAVAMSDQTQLYLDNFWEMIDEILNAILFALIGLQVLEIQFSRNILLAASLVLLVSLTARFIGIWVPHTFVNRRAEWRLPVLFTWCGLRGGLSIALALSLRNKLPDAELIIAITYFIVIFSILFQGLTISKLLKWLKMA